jgi:hypothetical protein
MSSPKKDLLFEIDLWISCRNISINMCWKLKQFNLRCRKLHCCQINTIWHLTIEFAYRVRFRCFSYFPLLFYTLDELLPNFIFIFSLIHFDWPIIKKNKKIETWEAPQNNMMWGWGASHLAHLHKWEGENLWANDMW